MASATRCGLDPRGRYSRQVDLQEAGASWQARGSMAIRQCPCGCVARLVALSRLRFETAFAKAVYSCFSCSFTCSRMHCCVLLHLQHIR